MAVKSQKGIPTPKRRGVCAGADGNVQRDVVGHRVGNVLEADIKPSISRVRRRESFVKRRASINPGQSLHRPRLPGHRLRSYQVPP
jgi:hypothetical protein